ncbi:hypothetical protein ACFL6Y_12040, partial [Elusimicrobiota bacterium]
DVISMVQYTLTFIEDAPAAPAAPPPAPAAPAAAPAPAPAATPPPPPKPQAQPQESSESAPPVDMEGAVGKLRVTKGDLNEVEYTIDKASTYIGKAESSGVQLKGGMFTPDRAAMIAKRSDGYYLVAVKSGYPKVNGSAIAEPNSKKAIPLR